MDHPSELSFDESFAIQLREKKYKDLADRCEKVYEIINQSHQNFFRLLYCLSREGELYFLKLGSSYRELFVQAMIEITSKNFQFQVERLPDMIEITVHRIEEEAKTRPKPEKSVEMLIEPLRSKPQYASAPIKIKKDTESSQHVRAKSASSNRRGVTSPRSNDSSQSTSPSPRSEETSPRKFLDFFSKKRNSVKKSTSPRKDDASISP